MKLKFLTPQSEIKSLVHVRRPLAPAAARGAAARVHHRLRGRERRDPHPPARRRSELGGRSARSGRGPDRRHPPASRRREIERAPQGPFFFLLLLLLPGAAGSPLIARPGRTP